MSSIILRRCLGMLEVTMSKKTNSVMPMTTRKHLNIRVPEALAVRLHIVARVRGKTTAEWASAQLQRSVDREFTRNPNLGAMEEALSRLEHVYLPASVDDLLGLAEVYAKVETCDGLGTRYIEPESAGHRNGRKQTKGSAMSQTVVVDPIHPGEILSEDFLIPLRLSQAKLASDLGIPRRRVHEIVLGKRSITSETARLLASYFRMSSEFWMNLQERYDIECRQDAENALKKAQTKTARKRAPRCQS